MKNIDDLTKELEDYIKDKIGKERIDVDIILPKLENIQKQYKGDKSNMDILEALIDYVKRGRDKDIFIFCSVILIRLRQIKLLVQHSI